LKKRKYPKIPSEKTSLEGEGMWFFVYNSGAA
jgi:hypothetical protein